MASFPLGTVAMEVLSGLGVALWDIKGKACGVPVYALPGGPCRDRICAYAQAHGPTLEVLAASARALVQRDYTTVKFAPHPPDHATLGVNLVVARAVESVRIVREAVGDDVDILLAYPGIEFNPAFAVRLARAVEPLHTLFIEELVLPENVAAMLDVKRQTEIPLSDGGAPLHAVGLKGATGTARRRCHPAEHHRMRRDP